MYSKCLFFKLFIGIFVFLLSIFFFVKLMFWVNVCSFFFRCVVMVLVFLEFRLYLLINLLVDIILKIFGLGFFFCGRGVMLFILIILVLRVNRGLGILVFLLRLVEMLIGLDSLMLKMLIVKGLVLVVLLFWMCLWGWRLME